MTDEARLFQCFAGMAIGAALALVAGLIARIGDVYGQGLDESTAQIRALLRFLELARDLDDYIQIENLIVYQIVNIINTQEMLLKEDKGFKFGYLIATLQHSRAIKEFDELKQHPLIKNRRKR